MSEPLGPSITAEFPEAVGLDKLLGAGPSATGTTAPGSAEPGPAPTEPQPSAAPVPVPSVDIPPDMIRKGLQVLDRTLSSFLACDPESPEAMKEVADTLEPLMAYYSKAKPTVSILWASAIIGIAGYGMTKAARYQLARKATAAAAPTPDTAPDGAAH